MALFTLRHACSMLGYTLIVRPAPSLLPQALGCPDAAAFAAACSGIAGNRIIACVDDSWDYAYAVAHEIAEVENGLKHDERTFSHQCNILAVWCKMLASSSK